MSYKNADTGLGAVWCQGRKIDFLKADSAIYEGSALFTDEDGKAWYMPTEGATFLGVASSDVASGDSTVSVYTEGMFEFYGSDLSDSLIGKTAYLDTAKTPQHITVTKPSSEGDIYIPLGRIAKVISSGLCLVRIDGYALKEEVLTV